MHIAVFGGAFDPPHLGHLTIARQLLQQKLTDEVWFLPARRHAFAKALSPDFDRLAMLQLLLEPAMRIETYELDHDEVSYTYRTLKALQKQHPEHRFSFIIGSDNIKNFDKWDHFEELKEEFQFYVYPRSGYSMNDLFRNMHPIKDVPEIDVSSTEIKEALQQEKNVSELLPPKVWHYLQENELYSSHAD